MWNCGQIEVRRGLVQSIKAEDEIKELQVLTYFFNLFTGIQ